MTSLKAIQDSLYWQKQVLNKSTDRGQCVRVASAILDLEKQIELINSESKIEIFNKTEE
jgi:hypothetical protein